MKSIITDIATYLGNQLSETVYIDTFPAPTGELVMVRVDPGQMVENRYIDGSRQGVFNFSVYARSMSSEWAYEKLIDAAEALDMGTIGNDMEIIIDAVNQPCIVGQAENGEYTYTASFRLEYHTEV